MTLAETEVVCDNKEIYTSRKKNQIRPFKPFHFQDLISKSPYCLPNNSYDVSSENVVLNHLIIPYLIFFFILITCLFDIVLIW